MSWTVKPSTRQVYYVHKLKELHNIQVVGPWDSWFDPEIGMSTVDIQVIAEGQRIDIRILGHDSTLDTCTILSMEV